MLTNGYTTGGALDRAKVRRRLNPSCKHGNEPEYCATCIKAKGKLPQEPDQAAIGPRVTPSPPPAVPLTEPAKMSRRPRAKPGERQPELVLRALRASKQPVFTREDIVVLAFRAYPAVFGMRTFPEYPDSSKIYALLAGERGLVGRKLLAKDKDGYRLLSA